MKDFLQIITKLQGQQHDIWVKPALLRDHWAVVRSGRCEKFRCAKIHHAVSENNSS